MSKERNINQYRVLNDMSLDLFCFVLKFIQNDIKDKYLFQLHNKNSRDSSLHYTPFLFYFREFPGIPWGFPITINRYQGISQSGQDQGPWQ